MKAKCIICGEKFEMPLASVVGGELDICLECRKTRNKNFETRFKH